VCNQQALPERVVNISGHQNQRDGQEKLMSTEQVRVERRAAQRFDVNVPVAVKLAGGTDEGHGFTQDLSARGALFYTDFPLNEGDAIELSLVMPSEITLAENMRVRCFGRVTRVRPLAAVTKAAVAVHLERYEYLPETDVMAVAGSFGHVPVRP
jgi:hypothetical protein